MKVMIIEDDILVRMGIKSLIPWSELGLEVVCEARDGAEAVELYETFLPDIALVDILLPKMNGLDFIEKVKPRNPHGEFIILTCNQDFETVRQSLRLGVHDFIVKSTMELEELQRILKQLVDKMKAKVSNHEHPKETTSEAGSRSIRKAGLLRDWLHGLYNGAETEEFAETLGEFKYFLEEGQYQAWVVTLNDSRSDSILTSQEVVKIGHSIDHMAAELYRGKLIGFVENIKDNRWHVLLRSGNDTDIDPELLIDSVLQYLGYSLSIAVSNRFTDWREWIEYDRIAGELLSLNYYREDDRLFQGNPPESTLSDAVFVWKKSMMNKLSAFQFEQAEDHLANLKQVIGPPYPRPTLVFNVLEDVLFQLKQISQMTGRRLPEAQFQRTELLSCVSLSQAVLLLHNAIQVLQDPIFREKSGHERKKFVDATELFIQEHPFEEISLNGIASHLKVSPVYLSRIYKEEKGISFSTAVLTAKVEQAETMIRSGMTLTEISDKLGYLNLSSFTRMFKKIKGIAPSHYGESD
ncbi:response regulator transcription factor [Paenibacillus paeoniae]|uniref:Response regulator n=1 Tax=Paenibacillus paeoniae TaxID=2292705 RepID=A0A371P5M1_9BACL|nr:response regulator [Paenibacillus paeoniae]REK71237.1 response regulator [Paenibacillus paeoniae]